MTFAPQVRPAIRLVVATALMPWLASPVLAETPLSLQVSQSLTRDSNILRSNDDKRSDLVSSTGVRIGFDKEYGRQTYSASVQGVLQRYKQYKEFDNDGFDINLDASTEIGARGLASISHARSRQLQDFGQQGLSRVREIIDYDNTVLNARYGLNGWWALTSTFSQDQYDYERDTNQNRESRSLRLGVRYNFTDLLYADFGVRRTRSELPNQPVVDSRGDSSSNTRFGLQTVGEDIKRTDVDVQAGWVVTGYSDLYARVGWTEAKHSPDVARSYKGLTWRVDWGYRPTGKLTYKLALDRNTNDSGGNSTSQIVNLGFISIPFVNSRAQERLTTAVTTSARWAMTGKTSSSLSYTWRRIEESEGSAVENTEVQTLRSTGYFRSLALSVSYAPTRVWDLACSLSWYRRTASLFAVAYSGDAVTCSASMTLD